MVECKPMYVTNHFCYECGWQGSLPIFHGKIICPNCKTINDVWLAGEAPPPNHVDAYFQVYDLEHYGETY